MSLICGSGACRDCAGSSCFCSVGGGLDALLAGMCARRRSHFLLSRQKKVTKEKATPLAVSLRFAAGNLRCSGAGRRCGTRCAAAPLRSDSRSESDHDARMLRCAPAPRPALLSTARGESNSTRAIAALGRRLAGAAAALRVVLLPLPLAGEGRGEGAVAARSVGGRPGWGLADVGVGARLASTSALTRQGRQVTLTPTLSRARERESGNSLRDAAAPPRARPSAAMARLERPSGCAEERSGRGEPEQRSMLRLRALTRCGCLNGALQARSEFRSAPRPRAPQAARSEAKGRSQRGRLFFGYFLLARQKKVTAPPGAHPGQQRTQPLTATTKTRAACAVPTSAAARFDSKARRARPA